MRLILFSILLLLAGACVEPFAFKPGTVAPLYVIDGKISDDPGPYTIRITEGRKLTGSKLPEPVGGAHVTITDDLGNVDELVETETGTYLTTSVQGTPGRTYTLNIAMEDGSEYVSSPQKIIPVGDMTNVRAELVSAPGPGEDYGFHLFLDSEFTPEQEKHVRWTWSTTFRFETHPEEHMVLIGNRPVVEPLPCSGYVQDRNGAWYPFKACTCCYCYKTIYNRRILISDENDVIDNRILGANLGFQRIDSRMVSRKMVIIVAQESLNPDVYAFWQVSKKQETEGSSLFQVPPSVTRGNISEAKAGSRDVVGLFAAVSMKHDTLVILDEDIHFQIPQELGYANTCLSFFYSDNTNIKPPWF